MTLAASNIAWPAEHDAEMYAFLRDAGFSGLEVAPSRTLGARPYARLEAAAAFREALERERGMRIVSMQSIWYGRTETLFDSDAAYRALLDYTKRAADCAEALGCPVLVFGCPRARNIPAAVPRRKAEQALRGFFEEAGAYAASHGAALALEATPALYGTNYMNTTEEAAAVLAGLHSGGCRLNLDVGTLICDYGLDGDAPRLDDAAAMIRAALPHTAHVHISEPHLAPVRERGLHGVLAALLSEAGYAGAVSVEMADTGSPADVQAACRYVARVFGGGR